MRKLFALVLTVFSFFCLSAAVYADNMNGLLVLLSKQANIQAIKDKPDLFQLTLTGVNPKIIYFSNRPARVTGQMEMTTFVNQWKKGSFKKVPPNAMMEAVKLNPQTKKLEQELSSYAMVLQNPVFNKSSDVLTFDVKGLPKSKMPLSVIKHSDYVAIFIDDVCITCIHG